MSMTMDRKVILYIAVSLEGYIAESDDNLEFLSLVEEKGEDYGYKDFIDTVDTVVMGRRTYDKVMSMGLGFPHADKESYIITRTPGPEAGPVKFFSGDLKVLIGRLKSGSGNGHLIWPLPQRRNTKKTGVITDADRVDIGIRRRDGDLRVRYHRAAGVCNSARDNPRTLRGQ